MDTYTFQGVIHEEVMGVDVELPLNFHIVLAPDAEEWLLHGAANAVVYAIAEKLKREQQQNLDGRSN